MSTEPEGRVPKGGLARDHGQPDNDGVYDFIRADFFCQFLVLFLALLFHKLRFLFVANLRKKGQRV